MLELFTNPDFLGLITLDKFRVIIAIAVAILLLALQSSFYSTDKNARALYFWVGVLVFTLFFILNVVLTQKASAGVYRPFLVGGALYDEVEAWLKIEGGTISLMEIQERLSLELWRWSWPALLTSVGIIGFGALSATNPPPRWRRGIGVDVMFAEFPNVIDYSIKAIFLQNLFLGLLCGFATVVSFDLVQLSALADQPLNQRLPPVFFQERTFDYRIFVTMIVAPLLIVMSFGKVWRARYRMVKGGLIGYRDEEMRKLAQLYRLHEREIKPDLGGLPKEQPEPNPDGPNSSTNQAFP